MNNSWAGIGDTLDRVIAGMKEPIVKSGMMRIIEERVRQIEGESYAAEHDDRHGAGEIAAAAATYERFARAWQPAAMKTGDESAGAEMVGMTADELLRAYPHVKKWPWGPDDLKPRGFARDAERAGALYIAERDRLDRVIESLVKKRAELQLRVDACAQMLNDVAAVASSRR